MLFYFAITTDVIRSFYFRQTSTDPDSIDLHGTTAAEAVQIVKETLQRLRPDAHNHTCEPFFSLIHFATPFLTQYSNF
jgi:hypothetical protein